MFDNYPTLILPHAVGNLMQYHTAHWKKKAESASILDFFSLRSSESVVACWPLNEVLPYVFIKFWFFCKSLNKFMGDSAYIFVKAWWYSMTNSSSGVIRFMRCVNTTTHSDFLLETWNSLYTPDISPYDYRFLSEIKGADEFILFCESKWKI